ncbi:MAG: resuscitation-promoting factor RpfA, partial [Sphingomonadales bacterium]|nr:resuscitation-promoting factor RpfA [Sphingomonadales bacterium]
MPRRLRATRVAAAAPNSRIIGGAGTWVPPVEPPDEEDPPLDDPELLLELDELVLDEDEDEPLVLPEEPKLLDPPVAPELVDDVLVDPPVAPELVDD